MPSPHSRATRAALVFGGAAMVSAAVACSSQALYGAPADPQPTPSSTTSSPTAVPLYGAPAPDSGPFRDASDDDATVAPLYGAPSDAGNPDSGPTKDGGQADAGRDGSPAPLYGLPPQPPE